jgi:hypothetical protein
MAKLTKAERERVRAAWLAKIGAQLEAWSAEERKALIEELISDFFVDQRANLVKWQNITGQSAQIDTGYIAQHLGSLVLQIPGQGFKGKGLDLADGSEVKSASILSGIDRPRWNHNLGTVAQDAAHEAKGEKTKGFVYLNETPFAFYVLFDRVHDRDGEPTKKLRVRAWCINARTDAAWRSLVQRYLVARQGGTYNLQLHPPVGYDDSVVVNELGNLDLAEVLVLDARFILPEPGRRLELEWVVALLEIDSGYAAKCVARPFVSRERPSRLEASLEE